MPSTMASSLKPLSSNNDKAPLFVVHPFTGEISCYLELGDRLKTNFSVFGIQSPGLEEDVALPRDIESLAAWYLSSILAQHEKGPFLICGWSAGGTIALEMGRQLQEQGRSDVQIIMLDAWMSKVNRSSDIDGASILAL